MSYQLIFLGPPGAGKGTQAESVCRDRGIPQISTGDILRGAIKAGTELGRKAKAYMDEGLLAPDDLIIGIMEERLRQSDCEAGFLLDGVPRTVPQAEAVEAMLENLGRPLTAVVSIDVPDEDIIARITGRRSCPKDGMVYHVQYKAPRTEGRCDLCGTELVQRADDTRETVENRLRVYKEQTAPLIDFYSEREVLAMVDGRGSIDEIAARVADAIDRAASRQGS